MNPVTGTLCRSRLQRRFRHLQREPEPRRQQRTTPPPRGFRAPSAAESRDCHPTLPPCVAARAATSTPALPPAPSFRHFFTHCVCA